MHPGPLGEMDRFVLARSVDCPQCFVSDLALARSPQTGHWSTPTECSSHRCHRETRIDVNYVQRIHMTMQNTATDSSIDTSANSFVNNRAHPEESVEYIIAQIRREVVVLRMEHKAILKRIELIKTTAVGLADVFGYEGVGGKVDVLLSASTGQQGMRRAGLTKICRRLLGTSAQPVSVGQMLEWIREQAPDLIASHKHPAAALRVVLRRLVSYGEAKERTDANNGRTWQRAGTTQ
jgi:hypothetical protein